MEKRRLRPYSVYLSEEHHKALRKLAKNRKASEMIRNAIEVMLTDNDMYKAAYNRGLRDAARLVSKNDHANLISIGGTYLSELLANEIDALEIL